MDAESDNERYCMSVFAKQCKWLFSQSPCSSGDTRMYLSMTMVIDMVVVVCM